VRVLFVNPGLDLGGAERSLLLLLPELRRHGIDATVAVFGDGPMRERLETLGFPTLVAWTPRRVRRGTRYRRSLRQSVDMIAAAVPASVALARVIRRERIDLVHTNGIKGHVIAGLAGRLARTPVIWHVRDFPPGGHAGWLFGQALAHLPSVVVTNSDAVARALPHRSRGPKIIAIANPVDLDAFAPAASKTRARRDLGLAEGAPTVGMVAHLTPWKGHEDFLQIARRVRDRRPDAQFAIAGGSIYETDGHTGYADQLRRSAAALGLSSALTFLGRRDDVPAVMAALDVLVHCPTAPEPFGRVLAEAMAAGRPVVASRCGGIPDVVNDGTTGTLVDPGDLDAFVAATLALIDNTPAAERMGAAGRRQAERLFGADRHAARVLDVYRAVCPSLRTAA
jgi:glycosyltransferase involved in cell wall biosynthesis